MAIWKELRFISLGACLAEPRSNPLNFLSKNGPTSFDFCQALLHFGLL
jgi:hypothetical protein